jgi:hypothetical protein
MSATRVISSEKQVQIEELASQDIGHLQRTLIVRRVLLWYGTLNWSTDPASIRGHIRGLGSAWMKSSPSTARRDVAIYVREKMGTSKGQGM